VVILGGGCGGKQPVDQEFEFRLGMGVSGEPDLTPIGGRQMDIDHLYGGELVEHAARGQPGREGMKATRHGWNRCLLSGGVQTRFAPGATFGP
jgi:hypothetical protein